MMLHPGEIFLPTDLGVMISYLDKRYQRNLAHQGIQMPERDISEMTPKMISDQVANDQQMFKNLFSFTQGVDSFKIEKEIRKKQHLSKMEEQFRSQQTVNHKEMN